MQIPSSTNIIESLSIRKCHWWMLTGQHLRAIQMTMHWAKHYVRGRGNSLTKIFQSQVQNSPVLSYAMHHYRNKYKLKMTSGFIPSIQAPYSIFSITWIFILNECKSWRVSSYPHIAQRPIVGERFFKLLFWSCWTCITKCLQIPQNLLSLTCKIHMLHDQQSKSSANFKAHNNVQVLIWYTSMTKLISITQY